MSGLEGYGADGDPSGVVVTTVVTNFKEDFGGDF